MTNLPLTIPQHHVSLPLAERVAGGGVIWLFGRVLLGGLFLISGIEKLMGLDQFMAALVQGGIAEPFAYALAPVAAVAETLGGFCILVGLLTTWASLWMIAFTFVAAMVSHRFWELQGDAQMTQMAHFMKNIMIVGAFCLLYVAGGGPYSIDRWYRQRSER